MTQDDHHVQFCNIIFMPIFQDYFQPCMLSVRWTGLRMSLWPPLLHCRTAREKICTQLTEEEVHDFADRPEATQGFEWRQRDRQLRLVIRVGVKVGMFPV